MAIAFVAQAEGPVAPLVSPVSTSSALTVALGDILEVHVLANSGVTITISDGGVGNTYTNVGLTPNLGGLQAYSFVAQNCAAASTTVTATASAGNIFGIYAKQIRGGATSGAVIGVNGSAQTLSTSGTNEIVSGNIAIGATPTNILLSGFCFNTQHNTPNPSAGTSPLAFTARTAVWATFGTGLSLPEDLRIAGAIGNVQTAFGCSGGALQFSNVLSVAIAYAEAGAAPPPPTSYFLESNEYF